MLIAISGSQGSGKSTVLEELEKKGREVVPTKFARTILDDWGVTLEEVNNSHDLTIKFQDELIKKKWMVEQNAKTKHLYHNPAQRNRDNIVFTERTFADLFTYALIDLGRSNDYSEWLNNYYDECLTHCQMYDHVYYIRSGKFPVEHDGVRGSNKHYSRMVDGIMLDVTRNMIMPGKLTIIDHGDLNVRVKTITAQVENIWTG